METTSQRTRELQAEFSGPEQTDDTLGHQGPPKVRWIHLPVNNMKWHEDVCLKLNSELKLKEVEETLTNYE
ncbi:hypothetical protein LMH87_003139 [Akanthomyces muscarius]|uniref:Uncharacterized protein n=1 Tax=Akanthomyces muscarius TaxID=2231603 RepID=A0A9W8Q2R0_AKAMU|nr:hypothetical protein LMH87_003139 [Akanthomyces muscarius]KAJ4144249.1 hypothetical protein LMH87_003139 [Akanthomyces muscarius]